MRDDYGDYGITAEQYHAGLDRLWAALSVRSTQQEDIFTLCANRIRELESQTQWQDISTAPKDGASILGWDGVNMTTIRRAHIWTNHDESVGLWALVECGSYAADGQWYPTHWQPLPPAPKETP